MRRRAILVRHGAVDRTRADPPIRPGAFYGGNADVPLSRDGEAEAVAAAKMIAADYGKEVSKIWSSPMRRALFGARVVGTALATTQSGEWTPPMPVEPFEAFREIDRGPVGPGWTDLTPEEIEARDGPDAIWRCANEQTLGAWKAINGGEGFCDLRARVLAQRDALLGALEPGAAGVVVSHMWVTRAMVGEALGKSDPTKVDVPTASVSVIDYPDGFSAHAFAAGECGAPIVQAVGVKPEVTPADAPKLGDVRGKPLE